MKTMKVFRKGLAFDCCHDVGWSGEENNESNGKTQLSVASMIQGGQEKKIMKVMERQLLILIQIEGCRRKNEKTQPLIAAKIEGGQEKEKTIESNETT